MTTYFAADMTNSFAELVELDLRNLSNPDLAPFFSGPNMPANQAGASLTTAQALLSSVGGAGLSLTEFTTQTTGQSADLFKTFLEAAGIESTFTDDLRESTQAAVIPELGARSTFIVKKAGTPSLTVSDIRDRIRDQVDASSAEHLTEPTLPVLADSDPYASARFRRMREYISRYLKV